jgi:hypothetical protein
MVQIGGGYTRLRPKPYYNLAILPIFATLTCGLLLFLLSGEEWLHPPHTTMVRRAPSSLALLHEHDKEIGPRYWKIE